MIIYDSAGYPTSSYNYGKGLIAKNFKELEIKFNLWKQNPKKFNENIVTESSRYFPVNKPKVKIYNLLHEYLASEFKYYI